MSGPIIASRADLKAYIGHFNAKEYERQVAYYAPDVRYTVGTLTLESPRAIAEFYSEFHDYADEFVALKEFAITGNTVAAALATRFDPRRDYLKHGLEFRAGVPKDIVTLAFYRLAQGKIHRIRMARYGGPASDFD